MAGLQRLNLAALGILLLGGSIAPTVLAQSATQQVTYAAGLPIATLGNANYRYCSQPQGESDRMQGLCFLFRKQGDEIIGQYFEPYTERSICLHGVVQTSSVSGFARQQIFSESENIQVSDRLSSDTLAPWDQSSGYLMLAQGRMLDFDGESQLAGYSGTALFPVAKLDLAEFYRYNAGSTLPPQNCELE